MGGPGSGRSGGGGRFRPKAVSKEEIAQLKLRLQGELAAARQSGDSALSRQIGQKIRYWDKKAEGAPSTPPGTPTPLPFGGSAPAAAPAYPDLATLLVKAQEYEAGLAEVLGEVSVALGREIKAGALTKKLLSIGIMLAWQKRITPQHLEKADLFCLGGGAALLVVENWAAFKPKNEGMTKEELDKVRKEVRDARDAPNIGGGAKPVG